jgi:DinB superfamily
MEIQIVIQEIKHFLVEVFDNIDLWFDKDAAMRSYKPRSGGWSIDQVLEHIALTNHFLLILIEKGTKKALANHSNLDLQEELKHYTFQKDKLTEVVLHQSFAWIRPAHMEPQGEKTPTQVRQQLQDQVQQCLGFLDQLKNGEGVLHKTTMTVNDLGKIDVYEYIYFLAQHGQRHVTQMEKVEREYGMHVEMLDS